MSEISIEWLGWLATILLLIGYYLNAKKIIESWIIWIVGNTAMLIYASVIHSYSIVFLSFTLIMLNVYGYISWKQNK